MKRVFVLTLVLLSIFANKGTAQVVKDPLLAYYHSILSSGRSVATVNTFTADFTGDGHRSMFITSEFNRAGEHNDYIWSIYYPLKSGGYKMIPDGLQSSIDGPSYIGYVNEIKLYGIVESGQRVVSVQYFHQGEIKLTFLGNNQEASEENYPQYFEKSMNFEIKKYSINQLQKLYPNPNANNIIKP